MVCKPDRTKRNREIWKLAVRGFSIQAIAARKKLNRNTVSMILNSYVGKGLLKRVDGSSPARFYDPLDIRGSAHAEANEETGQDDGGLVIREPFYDSLPIDNVPHTGYLRVHVNGRFRMKIRRQGELCDLASPKGGKLSLMREGSGGNGRQMFFWKIPCFSQILRAEFIRSKNSVFYIYVGEFYCDPARVSEGRRLEILQDRVAFISMLFSQHGWQLTDPEFEDHSPKSKQRSKEIDRNLEHGELTGQIFHYAKPGDPLLQFVTKDAGGIVTADGSPITAMETEIENPDDDELVQIYSDMPKTMRDLKHSVAGQSESINQLKSDMTELLEVLRIQAEAISSLSSNVGSLMQVSTQLTSLQMNHVVAHVSKFTGEGYQ